MKIGIGQINTRVGDFSANAEKILKACQDFARQGADFAVFPESAVSGYPLKDLVFYEKFIDEAQAVLKQLAPKLPLPALIGCPRKSGGSAGHYNSAYWVEGGELKSICDKNLLPNYGALNDARNFDTGKGFCLINFKGKNIGITICEDIWTLPDIPTAMRYEYMPQPLEYFASLNDPKSINGGKGLDLLVNISASVFSSTNDTVRHRGGLLCEVSRKVKAPVVWCNLVGGNDEIIFAGASTVVNASNRAVGEEVSKSLKKFEEDFQIIDLEKLDSYESGSADFQGDEDLLKALVMSVRDFVNKCGIKRVLVGLSGGIDSALVAAIAVEALGRERVIGVSMPSKISSQHSRDDARILAENLGIEFHTVAISRLVSGAESELADLFSGREPDVAEENIQSRARGLTLMAISNKFGAVVMTTGNKSECAVGYCTLYGDTCGAFAPICDIYKTEVYRLSNLINKNAGREIIPQNTIDKPPSAELRPDQVDQDSLPPYDVLDAILKMHIEDYMSVSDIVAAGFDRQVVEDVASKVAFSEYKRTQYPIGPKVSKIAYATDRKIPVAIRRGIQ